MGTPRRGSIRGLQSPDFPDEKKTIQECAFCCEKIDAAAVLTCTMCEAFVCPRCSNVNNLFIETVKQSPELMGGFKWFCRPCSKVQGTWADMSKKMDENWAEINKKLDKLSEDNSKRIDDLESKVAGIELKTAQILHLTKN